MKRFICLLLVVTQLAACTTLSTVPYGQGASATGQATSIAPGSQLRITFKEGGYKTLRVSSFTADEICAADGCFRAADIATVERAEVNGASIALLVILGVLMTGAIFAGFHALGKGMAASVAVP
jgi:hypothetical protein